MDQMQARPQTVSRARARESANGNAVGLPHLQPAAVGQTAKNWFPGSCDLLKRDRTIRSAHNQKRNKSETLHPTKTLQIDGFFTASKMQRVGWPFLRSMRQERPSENWRRHLLLFGSGESGFIGNLKREWICPPEAGRPRDTESTETANDETLLMESC